MAKTIVKEANRRDTLHIAMRLWDIEFAFFQEVSLHWRPYSRYHIRIYDAKRIYSLEEVDDWIRSRHRILYANSLVNVADQM